ncbi:MAG: hypothetical protein ACP5G1_03695 [Nanopusillaceae archaeon]
MVITNEKLERERIQNEILNKYLKFLEKEIDYNREIEEIEALLNSAYFKETYHTRDYDIYKVAIFIENKVIDMINNDNIKFFRIDHGFVLIMTYKEENRDKGYTIYKKNRFYLIDLRNNKIIDISNIIAKKHGNRVLKRIDEYDLNVLDDLHFSKIYNYLI